MMDTAQQTVVIVIGFLGFIGSAIGFFIFSLMMASRANAEAAAENRQEGKPLSNGFAAAAIITLIVIFVLALALGIVPPLLQRG